MGAVVDLGSLAWVALVDRELEEQVVPVVALPLHQPQVQVPVVVDP